MNLFLLHNIKNIFITNEYCIDLIKKLTSFSSLASYFIGHVKSLKAKSTSSKVNRYKQQKLMPLNVNN